MQAAAAAAAAVQVGRVLAARVAAEKEALDLARGPMEPQILAAAAVVVLALEAPQAAPAAQALLFCATQIRVLFPIQAAG